MRFHDDEKIIHELRPQPSVLVSWFFTKCIPVALVATLLSGIPLSVIASVSATAVSGNLLPLGRIVATVVLIPFGFLVLAFIYCTFLRKSYIYYITNQRCVFHGGVLRRVERSVPYHKITDVEISQHIGERLLGISRLQLFTPGTASMTAYPFGGQQRAEISFIGLRDSETPAETINGILSKLRATGE